MVVLQYEHALEGALGAIAAHKLVTSKDSSKVLRDCSKAIDALSVGLRKHLIEADKKLEINND